MYLLLVCRLYDITVIEKEKMYGKNLNWDCPLINFLLN